MSRMRKAYPPEFKAEAVLLAREDGMGVASIADELACAGGVPREPASQSGAWGSGPMSELVRAVRPTGPALCLRRRRHQRSVRVLPQKTYNPRPLRPSR
jgi:transposase-like protein